MHHQPVLVALAILHQEGRFLMQLRDNIPGIRYPGYWGFFGGHLESGETPEEGIKRELIEEIGHNPPEILQFDCYKDSEVVRYIYHAPLKVSLDQLVLNEGWDMDWLTAKDINRGNCYSRKADQIRPIGPIHRQILLDFMERATPK